MSRLLRHPLILLAVFWLISLVATWLIWGNLPTTNSQLVIVGIVLTTLILPFFGLFDVALLGTVLLVQLVINSWLVNGQISTLTASITVFGLAGLLSLAYLRLKKDDVDSKGNAYIAVALAFAEIVSVIALLPLSFLHKSLLDLLAFYLLWGIAGSDLDTRSIRSHFVYTAITVIVVVSTLLWKGLPH